MSKDSLNQGIDSEDLKTMVIDAGITLSPEQETELLLNPELKRAMHAVLWGEIQSTAKYRQHARLGENHSGTDNLFDDPNVDPIVASTPEENATVTVKKAVMKRRGIVRSFIASWFKSEDKRKKEAFKYASF